MGGDKSKRYSTGSTSKSTHGFKQFLTESYFACESPLFQSDLPGGLDPTLPQEEERVVGKMG
jgi:hypothetical protein